MSIALGGNLDDFGIAEVFQLIGQQGKTGVLEIEVEDQKAQLAFDTGRVVWASPAGAFEYSELGERLIRCGVMTRERLDALVRDCQASARTLPTLLIETGAVSSEDLDEVRDLLTQDTIFEVLRQRGGSFHFTTQAVQHDVPPEQMLGAEQILMDGLRMADEWQTFSDVLPSDDVIFRSVGGFEEYRQQASAVGQHRIASAERVFRLINGRVSARRVMDLARLGTFDGTRVLADLSRARLIEVVSSSRASLQRPAGSVPISAQVRWWMGAVCPLLVLTAVVALALIDPTARARDVGQALPDAPYQRIYDLFESRRMLHTIEANRYVTGRWPRDLAQRDATGLLGRETLAPASARPYYYAVREGGVLLLTPER